MGEWVNGPGDIMFADITLRELLDRFGSPDPTPGGGSAAALSGAVGTSLLAMVAGLPKTKTGAPEERAALDAARVDLLRHRDTLVDLIDRDAQAYDEVVAAYRLPKGTDDEKAARKAAIQRAMTRATETPLETMDACAAAMQAGRAAGEFGNPSAASDVGVGLVLLAGAMQGGALNVATNLDSLTDAAVQKSMAERVLTLMRSIHAAMGQAGSAGFGHLWGTLAKHAGYPEPFRPSEQAAVLVSEGLRQMGSPEAKQALELLTASSDELIASKARAALTRFGAPPT